MLEECEEGKCDGLNLGLQQGLEQGEKSKTLKIAKNMLKQNIEVKFIEKVT